MRLLITDYLRRWKWPFLGGFIVHAVVMMFAFDDVEKTVPLGVLAGSGFALMFEFMRSGGSRTYLALPLTTKDVARSWRFVALEFPVAFFLLALMLAALIAGLTGHDKLLNFERFTILAISQTLILGTMLFALTGLPASPSEQRSLKDNLVGGCFGLLWGFSIPAVILGAQKIPATFAEFGPVHWLVAFCLLLVTVIGWCRTETLVIKRAQSINRMQSSSGSGSSVRGGRKGKEPIRAFGGIPLHCVHHMRTTGLFGLVILLFNWGAFELFLSQKGGRSSVSSDFTSSQIFFFVPIITMIMALVGLMQLRLLRSLPLSRSKVAAVIVVWPMAFAVIYGIVAVSIHYLWFGGTFEWGVYKRGLNSAAAMLLSLPALLWFGFTVKGFICVFFFLPAVQILQLFSHEGRLAVDLPWWLCLIVVSIAFALTRRALESSRPWRAGALRFSGFRRA